MKDGMNGGSMKTPQNMRSDYATREGGVRSETADLGMNVREPEARQLDSASDGNPMSRAVKMVHRHNERGEHAPMICGVKMEDREGR